MDRIFHRHVGVAGFLGVAMLAGLALYFFLSRTTTSAVMGFVMLAVAAVSVERLIHTTYTLTTDGRLVVDRGRFSKPTVVAIADIKSVRIESRRWTAARSVVLEYGDSGILAVHPVSPTRFAEELSKRMGK